MFAHDLAQPPTDAVPFHRISDPLRGDESCAPARLFSLLKHDDIHQRSAKNSPIVAHAGEFVRLRQPACPWETLLRGHRVQQKSSPV
jgi:hypothetical protein